MIKKQVSDNEASLVLTKELINKVCEKCSNKENCLRLNYEKTLNNIEYLMKIALERGRATVIDVPKTMVGNCSRINVVIPYANNLSKQYKSQKKIQTNLDNSKILLGEQLFGIAQILKSLSYEVNLNITFNHDKEEKIIETIDQIRPYLILEGGDIEFVKYEDDYVYIKVTGTCNNCDMLGVEINDGIYNLLKEEIPTLKGVININL